MNEDLVITVPSYFLFGLGSGSFALILGLVVYIWRKNESKISSIDNMASAELVKDEDDNLKKEWDKFQDQKDKTHAAREQAIRSKIDVAVSNLNTKLTVVVSDLKEFFFGKMAQQKKEIMSEIKEMTQKVEKLSVEIEKFRHLVKNIDAGKVGQMDIYLDESKEIKAMLKVILSNKVKYAR